MIIEMSAKQMKIRGYLKQLAHIGCRRLKRFGVPINRIQIRLEASESSRTGREKNCVLTVRGQDNFNLNVRARGKTFRQAINASFARIEQTLRRQHAKQQLRDRRRLNDIPARGEVQYSLMH